MNTKLTLLSAIATLALGACLVPPSMFERASWGPPPDYWQDQGRYRQEGAPDKAALTAAQTATVESEASGRDGAPPTNAAPETATGAESPPLYAWDGGIVNGAPDGRVTTEDGTPRGVEGPPAGRAHIIELYQQVLDERDALSEEVESLRKTLQQTTLVLDSKTKESEELTTRVAALEAAHKELMSDNQTIAARLVQAQIRRLEAEKLLLEAHIEAERVKAEDAARAAAQAKSGSARARTPSTGDGHE